MTRKSRFWFHQDGSGTRRQDARNRGEDSALGARTAVRVEQT